jgi:hypothetical protein
MNCVVLAYKILILILALTYQKLYYNILLNKEFVKGLFFGQAKVGRWPFSRLSEG